MWNWTYALARLSQITCSSVLSLCLLDRCIYIMIAHQKVCHMASRNSKNIFPSTFRRDIGWKFVIPFDCISFGIQIPSARNHYCSTILFFQICWRRTVSFLRTYGQFLYNLYYISFMPGALPAWALWTKSLIYLSFIPLSLNITVESWGFDKSLRGGIDIPFIHLSISSSSDSRVHPSLHQACHS